MLIQRLSTGEEMSTVQNIESKDSSNWNSLKTLEHSRYKTGKNPQAGTGSRPTVKMLKQLDTSTTNEDKVIQEASLKADNDVKKFISHVDAEEQNLKKTAAIKKQVASLNSNDDEYQGDKASSAQAQQATNVPREVVSAKNKVVDKESTPDVIKEVFLGFGRLYINKTNNILNPLRFVMDNKAVVLRAILLFVIPAIMTWFFTTQLVSVQMELAKENMLIKMVYAVIFYFASMFVLFTVLIAGSGLWSGVVQSIKNAQKVGRS